MRRRPYMAIFATLAALFASTAPATANTLPARSHSAGMLHIVKFSAVGDNAPVDVFTDSIARHWRRWPVVTVDNIDPGNRCRFRNDARRVLIGKPPLPYFPYRCMTRFERNMKPDPSPR